MNEFKEFNIFKDGIKHKALIIMSFELYGNYYCIYGVRNKDKNYDIYCGEIINNQIVPVKENNRSLTTKIVKTLTNTVKR